MLEKSMFERLRKITSDMLQRNSFSIMLIKDIFPHKCILNHTSNLPYFFYSHESAFNFVGYMIEIQFY